MVPLLSKFPLKLKVYITTPRAGPTHMSLFNLPIEHVARVGEEGQVLIRKSPVKQPKSAGYPFENPSKANQTSNSTSFIHLV